MTAGDIHRVKEPLFLRELSYSFQLVTVYFDLCSELRLRLCSSFMSTESNMLFIYVSKPRIDNGNEQSFKESSFLNELSC